MPILPWRKRPRRDRSDQAERIEELLEEHAVLSAELKLHIEELLRNAPGTPAPR